MYDNIDNVCVGRILFLVIPISFINLTVYQSVKLKIIWQNPLFPKVPKYADIIPSEVQKCSYQNVSTSTLLTMGPRNKLLGFPADMSGLLKTVSISLSCEMNFPNPLFLFKLLPKLSYSYIIFLFLPLSHFPSFIISLSICFLSSFSISLLYIFFFL